MEVPGVGHFEIIYSDVTARTIVQWLDHTFGIQRSKPIDLAEPRLASSAFAIAVFVIFLIWLGRLCGSIATKWPPHNDGRNGLVGIVFVGIGLVTAMALMRILWPSSLVSAFNGGGAVPWFAAGGVILSPLALFKRLEDWRLIRARVGATLSASVLAFSIIYVCQIYIFLPFHRLALTGERLVIALVATLLTFPFWIAFEYTTYVSILDRLRISCQVWWSRRFNLFRDDWAFLDSNTPTGRSAFTLFPRNAGATLACFSRYERDFRGRSV